MIVGLRLALCTAAYAWFLSSSIFSTVMGISLEIWQKKSPEAYSEYSAKGDISSTTHLCEGYHDHSEVHLSAKGLALRLLCFGHDFSNKFLQLNWIVRWFQQVAAKIGDILYELDPLLGDVLGC